MSFFTALALSTNNLLTKKARTILTAFAGSIGIIGIALIMSLSNGIQNYIDKVQKDTLSSYPITIQAESVDMTSMMTSLMGVQAEAEENQLFIHTSDGRPVILREGKLSAADSAGPPRAGHQGHGTGGGEQMSALDRMIEKRAAGVYLRGGAPRRESPETENR